MTEFDDALHHHRRHAPSSPTAGSSARPSTAGSHVARDPGRRRGHRRRRQPHRPRRLQHDLPRRGPAGPGRASRPQVLRAGRSFSTAEVTLSQGDGRLRAAHRDLRRPRRPQRAGPPRRRRRPSCPTPSRAPRPPAAASPRRSASSTASTCASTPPPSAGRSASRPATARCARGSASPTAASPTRCRCRSSSTRCRR